MAENSAAPSVQPIILKRIKKAAHGSHGGVWKLAYADFVTAMMAFFLLLWLLNSVTQEQLQGISNYFAPVTTSRSQTGSGQVLGGKTVGDPGAAESPTSRATVTQDLPPPKVGTGAEAGEGAAEDDGRKAQEEEQFKEAEQELRKAVESVPALRQLANSLLIDNTPEGLRIQIVDQQGLALFPAGSSEMYLHTRRLLEAVAKVILDLPQKISIAGHTDSTGYTDETRFSNWELSADRANAARRTLLGFHVPKDRVGLVVGKAYVDPLKPEDPAHPSNRRLTIVLLRGTGDPASVVKKPAQGEPRRIREALPGLDAIRERQIQDENRTAPQSAPPPNPGPASQAVPPARPPATSPATPSASAPLPPPAAPPGTQPAARETLPGLDEIRERQRREDAAKKQKQ
jgi:chemotaxis protein MotB